MLLALLTPFVSAADTWVYYNSTYITAAEVSYLTDALADAGATVTTSTSAAWPTSWTGYRLVVILLPGGSFSAAQASGLTSFVNGGGRLAISGDWTTTRRDGFYVQNTYINSLMTSMGVGLAIGTSTLAGSGCTSTPLVYADQLTTGETTAWISSGSNVTGGTALMSYGATPFVAVAQPSSATSPRTPYDVVVSGDTNAMMGTCASSVDATANYAFWYNLYPPTCYDLDEDGFDDDVCGGDDCDDTDPAVYPGATETCNGIDDDCDGSTDESGGTTWYQDADGDGYGSSSSTVTACTAPAGYVSTATDCDDSRSAVHPGATETCNSIDDDCDGSVDESGGATWYRDADSDGYGTSATSTVACTAPVGYVSNATDCNDSARAVNPGATETCNSIDDDCDGSIDESGGTTWYRDADGDGYGVSTSTTVSCTAPAGYVATSTDCNDASATVHPGADEYCNGIDDDCDGTVDDTPVDRATWYRDSDGDGYGTSTSTTLSCSRPSGYVSSSTDCNDAAAAVNPAATEVCDSIDNDCDGATDETGGSNWYQDSDGDGYGNGAVTTVSCSRPAGYVSVATDCNDAAAAVNPGATEVCNSIDDDCDTYIDEAGGSVYYADSDGDGYGDPATTTTSCSRPTGYTTDATDCDDSRATVHPLATEYCNSIDDDCDGSTDEAGAIGSQTYYTDADGDGYGNGATSATGCAVPSGSVTDGTDCDDTRATDHPTATELCDSRDNDCDGSVDEGVGTTWYADVDGDSFGDPVTATLSCSRPTGYVTDATDCDDADALVYPDALEVCDGLDNDCDGLIDESDSDDVITWYADADGDSYGDPSVFVQACAGPAGYVTNDDDCWDDSASVNPDGSELADGIDEDCDGIVDEGTTAYDDDADGYSEAGGDCDDGSDAVRPGAVEVCDGVDGDCDGVVDEGTACFDDDGDGATEADGDCNDGSAAVGPSSTEVAGNGVDDDCDGTVDTGLLDADADGYSADGGDCVPEDASVHPGAPELSDGLDNDCDGTIDEGTTAYDDDGDGYTEDAGDCNDADSAVSPDGTDSVNGIDDNCDGIVDGGTDASDDDGDGYSEDGGDCDDADPNSSPAAVETANGVDDDCNGHVDDGLEDVDDDGVSEAEGDCDDSSGWVRPGQPEVCDGVDNNCDGAVDEACGNQDTGTAPKDEGGCGCATGESAGWLPALLGLAALSRRRRRA